MAFALPRGRMPTIEWMPLAELTIDHSYQRAIDTRVSQKLIRDIAENWDWDVLDVLKVSRRPDDSLFLVDGQHRLGAARLRGDITQLPCVVKRCANAGEEARLFIAANRGRKPMSRIDDFRAAVVAGDAEAIAIDAAVTAAGLSIASAQISPKHLAPGALANVAALRTLLRRYGDQSLADALQLLGEAFPDEALTSPSVFIEALIVVARDAGSDPDRLFRTMLAGTTGQWAAWARLTELPGGQTKVIALRDLIRHRYAAQAVAA